MPSILIDEFDAMRHLKIGAFTVGIRVKTPVDHDTSMKGNKYSENFSRII